jgi:phosphoenolpyruvate carboxylase
VCLQSKKLPVIPLFEDKASIHSGHLIIKKWLAKKENLAQVRHGWNGKMEVMLGYSDSAKQLGMLASRALIRAAMFDIEGIVKHYKLTPIFFHGAGGSVDRGGGSLSDQISWWPNTAIATPKLTIQGEMIQRTFATSEILNSQCTLLSKEARLRRSREVNISKNLTLDRFITYAESKYISFVSDKKIVAYCLDATPYHYLNILKLGSRPTKRKGKIPALESLRAIPWVLCWTQTRLLLPAWWGAGSAWSQMTAIEKNELIKIYNHDDFFSSFVNILGYTLAKVELGIWEQYLIARHGKQAKKTFSMFEDEYRLAVSFVHEVTQSRHLVSHRPWLEESIRLRSPYVIILNLLQIIAMQDENESLLKETLVGIACGMLTTG